jgi:ATP-dependent Clp protease ATP-binding subunit ClpC
MVTMGKLPQTPRARYVIKYAMEESHSLGHNYVGSEHILLGLIREQEGVAAQVLMRFGLNIEKARKEVFNLLGMGVKDDNLVPGLPEKVRSDELSQVLRLKKIAESALEEAHLMHHDYVGGEHVLLGLFHEQESVVAQVLEHFGLKINEVRMEILRRLGENKSN